MTENTNLLTLVVYGKDGNHHEVNCSKNDSSDVLRNLLGSVLNIPVDTVGGLRDRGDQKNYTYSPSILPHDAHLDILTALPTSPAAYSHHYERPEPKVVDRMSNINLSNGDQYGSSKKKAPLKTKRQASPPLDIAPMSLEDTTPPPKKSKIFKQENMKAPIPAPVPKPKPVKPIAPLSPELKECLQMLTRLKKHQYAWVFNKPVDHVAQKLTDYLDIIKHPMDLGTVQNKLEAGEYNTPEDLAHDIRLTFSNAITYNPPQSDVSIMATSMSKTFEKKLDQLKKEGKIPNTPAPEDPSNPMSSEKERETESSSTEKKEEEPTSTEEMTPDEKRTLSSDINSLEPEQLGELVQIIHQRMPLPNNGGNPDEIEIDLEQLDNSTLRYLEQYVKKCITQKKQ